MRNPSRSTRLRPWLPVLGLLLACAPAQAEVLRWTVIGDTGANCTHVDPDEPREEWLEEIRTSGQTRIAEHLAQRVEREGIRDIFFVGDNFYPSGLEQGPVGSACLELAFTLPYGKLLPPEHLHLMPGNHDYQSAGSVARQLALSGQIWTFYTRPQLVTLDPGLVDVIPFDSAIMVLNDNERRKIQRELTERLRESRAPWLVLMAHHPLETIGAHSYWTTLGRFNRQDYASEENRDYRGAVEQAIIESGRKVHVFIAGHDHSLQFIHQKARHPLLPDYHVISGSGSKISYVHSKDDQRWGVASYGFVTLQIDTDRPNQMVVRFMGTVAELRRYELDIPAFPWSPGAPGAEQPREAGAAPDRDELGQRLPAHQPGD